MLTPPKSRPIQLPVEALLKQFKDSEAGGKYPIIRNFDLMYIQQGVNRIDPKVCFLQGTRISSVIKGLLAERACIAVH